MKYVAERDLEQQGVRLFCLPHAGSGAAGFYRWKRSIAAGIAVCPIQLPGREARLNEPPLLRVGDIVEALQRDLRAHLTRQPYAIYGHSMSALIAFEWARAVHREGLPMPECLFVAGRNAPSLGAGEHTFHTLPDREMVHALVARYGGDAAVILEDEDLRAMFLPLLRADLEVVETYSYRPAEPLPCAVRAYAGTDDRSVTDAGLAAWCDIAAGRCTTLRIAGDHFFHFGAGQAKLLAEIAAELQSPRSR